MKKLTRRLKKRRLALLERYDEEELHQLRITLRRMRAQLKGAEQSRLQQLRRDLGTLADTTNAARDWDTLDARIIGDKAYCEYYRQVTHKDGSTEACNSVDILTFREQKIVKKDTYFKQVT